MTSPALHSLLACHRLSHRSFLLRLLLLSFVLGNFSGRFNMGYVAFLSSDPLWWVARFLIFHWLLLRLLFLFLYRLIDDCSLLNNRLLFLFLFYSVFLIFIFVHIWRFFVIATCLLLRRLFRTILVGWTWRWILISWVHGFVFFISFLMDAISAFRVLFSLLRGKGNLLLRFSCRCGASLIWLGLGCSKGRVDNGCACRLVASCDVKLELFFRTHHGLMLLR